MTPGKIVKTKTVTIENVIELNEDQIVTIIREWAVRNGFSENCKIEPSTYGDFEARIEETQTITEILP